MVESRTDVGCSVYGGRGGGLTASSSSSFRVFIAKYSYDPEQYSPNDNPDVELALTAGDYLFVYGDMDEVRETTASHGRLTLSNIPDLDRGR